ncbi:hypothetical protein BC829DRAFT_494497 [Chytridium lagenaria]|nr:hypothetical protein BC829DRAFT_494497 [Chytridium lagenaria]
MAEVNPFAVHLLRRDDEDGEDEKNPASSSSSIPSECLPLDHTTICAPWTKGYYINATAVTEVYSVWLKKTYGSGSAHLVPKITTPLEWESLLRETTASGPVLESMLSTYLRCDSYQGQPIQYYRTFACLKDVFGVSARCNEIAGVHVPGSEQKKKLGETEGKIFGSKARRPKHRKAKELVRREEDKDDSKDEKDDKKDDEKKDDEKKDDEKKDDKEGAKKEDKEDKDDKKDGKEDDKKDAKKDDKEDKKGDKKSDAKKKDDGKPKQTHLCRSTCTQLSRAIVALVDSPSRCPRINYLQHYDKSVDAKLITDRREWFKTAQDTCKQIILETGHQEKGCTHGLGIDNHSCGFAGDMPAARAYCQHYNFHPECCKQLPNRMDVDPSATSLRASLRAAFRNEGLNFDRFVANGIRKGASNSVGGSTAPSRSTSAPPPASTTAAPAPGINSTVIIAVGVIAYLRNRKETSRRKVFKKNTVGLAGVSGAGAGAGADKHETKYKVLHDYESNLPDEIELRAGDYVDVHATYDDGWGRGTNLSTGKTGVFPMQCFLDVS